MSALSISSTLRYGMRALAPRGSDLDAQPAGHAFAVGESVSRADFPHPVSTKDGGVGDDLDLESARLQLLQFRDRYVDVEHEAAIRFGDRAAAVEIKVLAPDDRHELGHTACA